jgi:hypothetical protein
MHGSPLDLLDANTVRKKVVTQEQKLALGVLLNLLTSIFDNLDACFVLEEKMLVSATASVAASVWESGLLLLYLLAEGR